MSTPEWHVLITGPDRTMDDRAETLEPLALSIFEDGPRWRLEMWFDDEPAPDAVAHAIGVAIEAVTINPVAQKDWVTLSQQARPAVHAGRFWLYGTHEATAAPQATIPILMDAGLAFGTGHHGTTSGCLIALSHHAARKNRPFNALDLGTGTGVLAIAMAKLWPDAPIMATDIDPVAIDVTRANAALNACTGRLALQTAPGLNHPTITGRAPYDLIVANILAGPLIKMARDIASAMTYDGTLILSGLLRTQARAVQLAYRAQGLVLKDKIDKDEWSTLVLEPA
ncbi:MAG: 50S ribosomal protein L11 methyltransferase [Alphaproteobacteria bacterium]